MTGSSRVLSLGLAAMLAVLPACSESERPQPTTLPPLTSTPTPTPSPSGTPTASTTGSRGQFDEATQAEAEAFVRDWWAATSQALSGAPSDVERLRSFFDATCGTCQTFYGEAKRISDKGQRVEGAQQAVLTARFDTNEGPVALVNATVQSQPGELIDRAGRVLQRFGGGEPVNYVVNVVQTGDRWVIQDLLNLGS